MTCVLRRRYKSQNLVDILIEATKIMLMMSDFPVRSLVFVFTCGRSSLVNDIIINLVNIRKLVGTWWKDHPRDTSSSG